MTKAKTEMTGIAKKHKPGEVKSTKKKDENKEEVEQNKPDSDQLLLIKGTIEMSNLKNRQNNRKSEEIVETNKNPTIVDLFNQQLGGMAPIDESDILELEENNHIQPTRKDDGFSQSIIELSQDYE